MANNTPDNDWEDLPTHDDWEDAPIGDDKPDAAEAFVKGAGQGASFGFADEIAGAAEAVGSKLGLRGVGGSFSDIRRETPEEDKKSFAEVYREGRDARRDRAKQAQDEHPIAYGGGEFAGGVATSLLPGGQGKAGVQVARALGEGALSGLGHSEADGAGDLALDAVKGAGINGAFAAPGIALGSTKDLLKALAERRAVKALGPTLKQQEILSNKGMSQALGRELLDNGAVKFGSSVEDMAPRIEKMLGEKGARIGAIRNAADQAGAKIDMRRTEAMGDLMTDAARYGDEGEAALADAYKRNAQRYSSSAPDRTIAQTQDAIGSLGSKVNFDKAGKLGPDELAYKELRGDLVQQVDDQVAKRRPDLAAEYGDLKQQFGMFKEGDKILDKSTAREARNADIGLRDLLVAKAATNQDGMEGGLKKIAALLAMKAARERGNAATAVTADMLSKAAQPLGRGAESLGKGVAQPVIDEVSDSNGAARAQYQAVLDAAEKRNGPAGREAARQALLKNDPRFRALFGE